MCVLGDNMATLGVQTFFEQEERLKKKLVTSNDHTFLGICPPQKKSKKVKMTLTRWKKLQMQWQLFLSVNQTPLVHQGQNPLNLILACLFNSQNYFVCLNSRNTNWNVTNFNHSTFLYIILGLMSKKVVLLYCESQIKTNIQGNKGAKWHFNE